MNKLNADKIATAFEMEVDGLLAYYSRAKSAFSSTPTSKSDVSLLSEQVFLFAAISFEGALSDLYFAHVNKDSSLFLENKEQRIKDVVSENFGTWYSARIAIPHAKHLSADDLYPLLDPRGYNITFKSMRNMVAQSKKNLVPPLAAKYKALTPAQRKLGDFVMHLRNYMAHRSDSGFESMTDALASLATSYPALARGKEYRVNSVGAYLKSWTGAESRTELFLKELRSIVNAIGR